MLPVFLTQANVTNDNNVSESEIRNIKVKQKILNQKELLQLQIYLSSVAYY